MDPMQLKPKRPGHCLMCDGPLGPELKGHVCSVPCFKQMLNLDADGISKLVLEKFEIDKFTREAMEWALEHPEAVNGDIEKEREYYNQNGPPSDLVDMDFPRPMGVTMPPKIVEYHRDRSPHTWYKGKTDAEVVEDFLATAR